MIAVAGAYLLGFVDDRKQLSARTRLLASVLLLVACLEITPAFVVEYLNFSFLPETIQLGPYSTLFTVIVIVGLINAANMVDGMNGLLCGLLVIWSAFLVCYAPPHIANILALLMVFLFLTLLFNLRGRLFLGDSGAYGLSIAIALVAIYLYNSPGTQLYADVVVVWFAAPVVDCLRLISTRIRDNKSPMSADRNHLHHRLQRIVPNWGALLLYWLLVAVPGAIAIAIPTIAPAMLLSTVCLYFILLVVSSERYSRRIRQMWDPLSGGLQPVQRADQPNILRQVSDLNETPSPRENSKSNRKGAVIYGRPPDCKCF